MGCDVHLFVEYIYKEELESAIDTNKYSWRNFGSKFNLSRDYTMFSIIAGVRGSFDKSFPKKGMVPITSMGWRTQDEAVMRISESRTDYVNSVTIEEATKWNKRYGCKLYKLGNDDEFTYCDNPDNHSFSWLSSSEYEQALNYYKELSEYYHWNGIYSLEWEAILSILKTLEKDGDFVTRIVFWFDN
jgi:hypothetical protein